MKLIFAGTPDFAVLPLEKLHSAFGVAAVLTQPDRPQGRKGILTPPPVKQAALALGIPVLQPESLKRDPSVLFQAGGALLVTCAYGQILTQEVLDLYPMGVWNVHASLLPSYRGAAPIPRVIMDGCRETGVTIMKTDIGLDTGDIFLQERCPVYDEDTADALAKRLCAACLRHLPRAYAQLLLRFRGKDGKRRPLRHRAFGIPQGRARDKMRGRGGARRGSAARRRQEDERPRLPQRQ